MQNLYWKSSKGKTLNLVDTPFKTEEQLEKYIFDNAELLEDVFIFKRQIRTGSRQGIPDMLGVDQDGTVCLIELKNDVATEDVLPQVLQYAIWAETNPDSIKALWLESKERPDDVEVNWDGFEIRILVIAPAFRPSVLSMSHKIGYVVELLQVKRFVSDTEEFVLVEKLEEVAPRRSKTTKGKQTWDRAFYEREHGKEATATWFSVAAQMERIVKKHGWEIRKTFNKYYIGFRYGNTNPFCLHWGGTRAWNIQAKVPEAVARKFRAANWEFQRYDAGWKQAVIRPKNARAKVTELESLLKEAYQNIRGKE